jgi:putative MATE family efflux protein
MKTSNTTRLGTEPIGKLLFEMSSQTILALMVYAIYSITDIFFVSRGVGPLAAAGVSVSSPLLIALGAISTTVGAGGASIVSRELGAKNEDKASKVVANAFIIFWSAALLVTIFGLIFLDELILVMGATENILPYAKSYGRIILIGAISSTGYSAIVRADGNIKYSTAMWLIPVGANIALDPLFIYGFRWGVAGAAAATVIAQVISAGMGIYFFFFKKRKSYLIKTIYFIPSFEIIKEIVLVGLPSFLKNMSASLMAILTNNLLKELGGDAALSVYAIAGKLYTSLSTPQVGIMQGMQPIAGYNYGLKEYRRVKMAMRLSVIASIIYGLLVCTLCLAIPSNLLSAMSKDRYVVISGIPALQMMSLAFPLAGIALMVAAYFQATGKASKAIGISLGGIILVRIPVLLILSMLFGLNGIWLSEVIAEAILCTISLWMLRRFQKSLI